MAGYTTYSNDMWILKLDQAGDIIWQKIYGWLGYEYAKSIQQTTDGGYIVAGYTQLLGVGDDVWVLKLDSDGLVIWQKTYGGSSYEEAYSIQQTTDGGYIVAGYTQSFGAGSADIWKLKLDSIGEITWQKKYGDGSYYAYAIEQTSDGGYIVAVAEKQHEKRYQALRENILTGRVTKKDAPVKWVCRNCGYVHEGAEAPDQCPACAHPREYYEVLCENW